MSRHEKRPHYVMVSEVRRWRRLRSMGGSYQRIADHCHRALCTVRRHIADGCRADAVPAEEVETWRMLHADGLSPRQIARLRDAMENTVRTRLGYPALRDPRTAVERAKATLRRSADERRRRLARGDR